MVLLKCFSNNPLVNNISKNCVTVAACCVCAPQVFLPLKKWEAAWLGWRSAALVPKATFLKGLHGTWGFNCVILPKNTRKKNHKLLHCLGRSHGGIPAGLTVTQAESSLRKGFGMPCSSSAELLGQL